MMQMTLSTASSTTSVSHSSVGMLSGMGVSSGLFLEMERLFEQCRRLSLSASLAALSSNPGRTSGLCSWSLL